MVRIYPTIHEYGPIFPTNTDKRTVLAVSEESGGSHLTFVPLQEAMERGLSFQFKMHQPNSKASGFAAIPLQLSDHRYVSLYTGHDFRLAHAPVRGTPKQADMVYFNENRLGTAAHGLPLGISITTSDFETLRLDSHGRLGPGTGNKAMDNGYARGYVVGVSPTPAAQPERFWMLIPFVLGVGVYVLCMRAAESVRVLPDVRRILTF
jgi:hypothetical protein